MQFLPGFCMTRKTLMFYCGIKGIYRKSVSYPRIMGRFQWSAVGRTEEFIRNRTSDNAPKAFLASISHIQKSSRVDNPTIVEESLEPGSTLGGETLSEPYVSIALIRMSMREDLKGCQWAMA